MYAWKIYITDSGTPETSNALQRMLMRYHRANILQDLLCAAGFIVNVNSQDPTLSHREYRTITAQHTSKSAMTAFILRHSEELSTAIVTELG